MTYQALVYSYNIYLHPLKRYPGPRICAASALPLIRQSLKGNAVLWMVRLHQEYGEVVRVSPNELSFNSAGAWKDIYGHRKSDRGALQKDPRFYQGSAANDVVDIINANDADHGNIRRVFANAFSDRALKKQESLFLTHVDKLISLLGKDAVLSPSRMVNMVDMFNFTTFDIMGDLAFGETLNMLDESGYHPWVSAVFANFRFGTYLHCIRYFPSLENVLLQFVPRSLKTKQKMHGSFSQSRVDRRLEKQDARPDIWGLVLQRGDCEVSMSRLQMYAHSNLFMIAGTETTATLLSGLLYYLLTNREKLARLTVEIRGAFENECTITIERLQSLKYLQACIDEGLRMYPPISNGLPRLVPSVMLMDWMDWIWGSIQSIQQGPEHQSSRSNAYPIPDWETWHTTSFP